jgi:hypothetical protein
MNSYLIALILILCFTCWLADSGGPPMASPIGIKGSSPGSYGMDKQEMMYSDFLITEGAKNNGYVTKIDEKSPADDMTFPWTINY